MQIGELNSIVQALLTWLISKWEIAASGLAVTALFVWICARTGSTHVLNKRLWRLVLGKHDIKSPVLATFAEERDDLMNFRTMTALKRVPTAAAAERLVLWSREFDIDMDLVAAAGHHFDVATPGFKRPPPGPKAITALMVLTVVFLYGGLVAGGLGASMPPVIQVKASKIWYAVTDDRAARFQLTGGATPAIESASCNDQPATAQRTGYPSHDVAVMCELLSTEAGNTARHNAHLGQIVLGAFAALALLFTGLTLFREMWRAGKARELHKLLEQRQETDEQMGVTCPLQPYQ